MKRPLIAVSFNLVCLLFLAVSAYAVGGRISGEVVGPDGNPLSDVSVLVTMTDSDSQIDRTTNKKGKFTIVLLDATKEFMIRFEKEGYETIEEPLNPPLNETMRQTWTMVPGEAGGAGVEGRPVAAPSAEAGRGRAARLYGEGVEAFDGGDLDTARTSFEEVIALEPDLVEAHSALAMTLIRQDNYADAAAAAGKVLELKPDDVLAMKIQHESYRELGDTQKKAEVVEALIVYDPGPETARLVFNSAVGMLQAQDLEGAAARFEQAKQLDPELAATNVALTRVYFDMERFDDAIAEAQLALEKEPDNSDALGMLYLVYEQKGMTEEATATFESLKAANPDYVGRVLQDLGVSYFNAGQIEKAQMIFERVLDAQPDHGHAHYFLALSYASLGDTAKAKELLQRFLELEPDHPDAAVAAEMLRTM